MKLLITGARGFVGRHVLARLASTGAEVHAVTSGPVPDEDGVTWHRADLLDPSQFPVVVRAVRADTLLHLAWCAKPPDYWRDLDNVRWVSATLELARAFVDAGGRRIVAAGSCAEYDWRQGTCAEWTTPVNPHTLYGASKAACGTLLQALARELGVPTAWARLFFMFGPHDSPARLVPSLIATLQCGKRATCVAGAQLRDYLYVKDAADALLALAAGSVTGPVNLGSGIPVRLGTLAAAVAGRMGLPDRVDIAEGSTEHPIVAAVVDRLRDEVGWSPRYDLATALDETIAWWTSPHARAVLA